MVRHKFNAVPTTVDYKRFASKREAAFYKELLLWQENGYVLFFHRQIPIELPGKTKYIVDFQVFYADGRVEYIDVKGVETAIFKMKARQIAEIYPFQIKVVK